MMYNQYNTLNTPNMQSAQTVPTIPRLTKKIAEEYIASSLGVHPQNLTFVKLVEPPNVWKHACLHSGVVLLQPRRLQYGYTVIDFGFCSYCATVHYSYENPN